MKLSQILLRECSPKSFLEFQEISIDNFVKARCATENIIHEIAYAEAHKQFIHLSGLKYNIVHDLFVGNEGLLGEHVGWNWVGVLPPHFHHLHLIVRPEFRRRGISKLVAIEVDRVGKQWGFDKVYGQVWGSEKVALQNHLSNGFKIMNYVIAREIK